MTHPANFVRLDHRLAENARTPLDLGILAWTVTATTVARPGQVAGRADGVAANTAHPANLGHPIAEDTCDQMDCGVLAWTVPATTVARPGQVAGRADGVVADIADPANLGSPIAEDTSGPFGAFTAKAFFSV